MTSANHQTGSQELQTTPLSGRASKRLRRFLIAGLLILLGLCGARLLAIQGLLQPVRIVGGSMAETLLGKHFTITCQDCKHTFRCDAEAAPQESTVCPNCGYKQNKIDSQPAQDGAQKGERVLIDRFAFLMRQPRRGEIVVLRTPGDESVLTVKRIAALPGEQLAIRSGDLYINHQIHRKTFAELCNVAILVHNNDSRPVPGEQTPPRWQADKNDSRWQAEGNGFLYQAQENRPAVNASQLDWLTYRHWRCLHSPLPRGQESPLLDSSAYNQSISRSLHETSDFMLDCQIRISGTGKMAFLLHDGRDSFQWKIDTRLEQVILFQEGQRLASTTWSLPEGKTIDATVALCDQQAFLTINGELLIRHAYQPSDSPFQPTSRPLAIGASGLEVRISSLQVSRDIYYLSPNGIDLNWSLGRRLKADEFFLLGDNPPISIDSRFWTEQSANEKMLVGKVLRPWKR